MELFWGYLGFAGSALFVLFFFGMCVFVHELGHFLVAKWRGLHVVAFSIGFKKAWGKKINGVEYRIGWIPAGGYVDLPQIDTTEVAKDEAGNDLPPVKPLDRLLTALAGPLSNIVFGLLLGCVIWIWGIPQETPALETITVDYLIVDSPEYRAGLRPGDEIVKLNGEELNIPWNQFNKRVLLSVGEVDLEVRRGDEILHVVYQPIANPYVSEELRREKMGLPFFGPKIPFMVSPLPDTPAAKSGVKNGDIVLRANDNEVANNLELGFIIAQSEGLPVYLTVKHNGETGEETLIINPEKRGEGTFHSGVMFASEENLKILDVVKYSPADAVGIQSADIVLSVNLLPVANVSDYLKIMESNGGKEIEVELKRGDDTFSVNFTPVAIGSYMLGVNSQIMAYPNPVQQFVEVLSMTYDSMRSIGVNIANKMNLTEKQTTVSAKNLSGPIGILVQMHRAVSYSLLTGVYMVVFISFALAIFNLLPLPVLDGGHIFFALVEIIARRPVPRFIVKNLSVMFIVLLIGMMAAVSVLDIMRFVPVKPLDKEPVIISIEHPDIPETASVENESTE